MSMRDQRRWFRVSGSACRRDRSACQPTRREDRAL